MADKLTPIGQMGKTKNVGRIDPTTGQIVEDIVDPLTGIRPFLQKPADQVTDQPVVTDERPGVAEKKKEITTTPVRVPRTATKKATIWNPKTGVKKVVAVGSKFPTGFQLWTAGKATSKQAQEAIGRRKKITEAVAPFGMSAEEADKLKFDPERVPRTAGKDKVDGETNGQTGDGGAGAGVGEGEPGVGVGAGVAEEDEVKESDLERPDKEKIRAEKLDDAQAIMDVINESYDRILRQEEFAGEGREGRVRALNVSSGLGGSDFASANAIEMEEKNKKILQSIEAQRDAKIQTILNDVKNDTDEMYEARRAEFKKDAEDEIEAEKEFQKQAKTDALDRVTTMAGVGLDIDEFKSSNPDVYKNLLRDSGLTEIEFDSIWNAKSKSPVNYQYKEMKDGTLLRTGSDGSVKEMGDYSPPDDDIAWKIESIGDGSLHWVKKDEEGNIIEFEAFKSTKPKLKTVSPTTQRKVEFEEAKSEMTKQLSGVVGADNFISPDNYNIAKKAWIGEGYSPGDFDDEYQAFRNPNNPNYNVGGVKAETTIRKEQETEKKEEAKEEGTIGDSLQTLKDQGFSKKDIEASAEAKYGRIPDVVKDWLDNNF